MLRLGKLLSRLPIPLLQALGAILGWLVWLCSSRHRRLLAANLAQSGLNAPLSTCITHQGVSALEMFAHWLRPIPDLLPLVTERHGWEHVEAALASRRPLIFITPHLGALEMSGVCVAGWVDRKMAPLYRPPKQAYLEPLMVASRSRSGAEPAPANSAGVRILLRNLKQGGVTFILPDQTPGNGDGVWAPFFGRLAFTMTLISRVAVSTDAIILCCHTERLGFSGRYRFSVQPMTGEFNGDPAHDAALLNQNMEELIRQNPGQYLWSYNRYKQPAGAPEPGENP